MNNSCKNGENMFIKRFFWFLKNIFTGKGEIIGEIANKRFLIPIYIKSKKFGKSTYNPVALRIVVDKEKSEPAGIGKIVNDVLFKDNKKFEFNVCFSCGGHSLFGKGIYADPKSIWFNVFIGYYEVSAPKSLWDRPFGYNKGGLILYQDLKNLGKADWNYFSAYMYGVPQEKIEKVIHNNCETNLLNKKEKIGDSYWNYIELNNLETVSAYQSDHGEKLKDNDEFFTPLWQISFGKPISRKEFDKSFFKVNMKMKLFMSYEEEYDDNFKEVCYKTHMFGGSINLDYPKLNNKNENFEILEKDNIEFLEEQMNSVRDNIKKYYSHLGFRE